ncbi:MAG: type II toxin-antitoxin system HicB family antitoxin [Treponema sp.]|jgi:predicted RNase H-like HicB family nuclease/DNA-binding XRE family transcriptional regulator|nr:type II toxin-antitoxin system HicB family antitoxin [Treponema sp.]
MTYHFVLHKEDNGYWAECCELAGCVTQADTLEELYVSCEEALNLYLEEPSDTKVVFPLPNEVLDNKPNVIKIAVHPEIALAVLLRHYRSNSNITQKQAAEMLGMKNIYSYQRLEKKSNPTLTIIKKIHSVFPEIKLDYLLS